jgi:hypothetical protein
VLLRRPLGMQHSDHNFRSLMILGYKQHACRNLLQAAPKWLLGVIFHPNTAKMGIWTRLLREILAHKIDCMQVSTLTRLYFTQ